MHVGLCGCLVMQSMHDTLIYQHRFNSFQSLELSHCSWTCKHNLNIKAILKSFLCFRFVYTKQLFWLFSSYQAKWPKYSREIELCIVVKTKINRLIFDVPRVALFSTPPTLQCHLSNDYTLASMHTTINDKPGRGQDRYTYVINDAYAT